jgi:small subunit ribosomal protein S13
MVHILGVQLPDNRPARVSLISASSHVVPHPLTCPFSQLALTGIYGIGRELAKRICARLQIHETATLPSLTPQQLTALTAFLSSPSSAPPIPPMPLASPTFVPLERAPPPLVVQRAQQFQLTESGRVGLGDRLRSLKIEVDLRREVRENIAHHKQVGSYIGRRHAMGLPVRGQRTHTNAGTARKLNKVERRG